MDKEIADSFREESNNILKDLRGLVVRLDYDHKEYPAAMMAEFSQKIDRIMGAAQTLEMATGEQHIGLKAIGSITGNCKKLGQQAAALNRMEYVKLVSAFWDETLDVLEELMNNLEDAQKSREIVEKSFKTLQSRLEWLSKQVSKLVKPEELEMTLKKMGLR